PWRGRGSGAVCARDMGWPRPNVRAIIPRPKHSRLLGWLTFTTATDPLSPTPQSDRIPARPAAQQVGHGATQLPRPTGRCARGLRCGCRGRRAERHRSTEVPVAHADDVSPALDVMQGAALQVAKTVEEMSGGRLRIEVFPAGQIMPALGCFDAASQGSVE